MMRSRGVVVAVGLLAAVGSVLLAAPAQAATATSISFNSTATTVAFGSNWAVGLTVTISASGFTGQVLDTQDGTVDVTIDGIPGTYATGVPIYRGGQVFLSPPDDAPLLAAGAHVLHAVFRPAAGSGLVTSQTAKPMTLTVTPLALAGATILVNDASVVGAPIVRMSLSGAYVDTLGTPPGSWAVKVESAGVSVFDKTVAQPAGSTAPVDVSIAEAVQPGRTLTFSGTFTPDSSVAGGITLTNSSPATFAVPTRSVGEVLSSPVVLPWWLFILLLLVVLGLVAAAIVLLVRNARAAAATRKPDDPPVDEPDTAGEPELWSLSPSGSEPEVDPVATEAVETRVLVQPEAPRRDDFPLPGTADLAPLPEPAADPAQSAPQERDKPTPQSWTLSSSDDDDA